MKMDLSSPEYIKAMEEYLLGDRNVSRATFEALARKYPREPAFPLLLGNIKYSLGLLQEASSDYEKAIELDKDYEQAYFRLGVCYVRMGRLDKALQCFERNVRPGAKGHVMSYYWLGIINSFLGRDDQALEAFTRLHNESKESQLANFFLAQLLMKRNEHSKALALLQELLALTPDFAEVHYLIGLAYAGMYKNLEAIQSFRRTLELNPSDKRAQMALERYMEGSAT